VDAELLCRPDERPLAMIFSRAAGAATFGPPFGRRTASVACGEIPYKGRGNVPTPRPGRWC